MSSKRTNHLGRDVYSGPGRMPEIETDAVRSNSMKSIVTSIETEATAWMFEKAFVL